MDAHFAATGRSPRDAPGMFAKTAVILAWLVCSYLLLVFWAGPWTAWILAVSLGLALACVGFNIQHDGGHRAYSRRPGFNALMAHTLDLVGGSSYFWNWKHNVFHHSNPNVAGLDDDIDFQPLCRLAPSQPRRAGHRFQHLYVWPLYSLLAVKWHFIDDYRQLWTGEIGGQRFPRPRRWALVVFAAGKLFFYCWAIALPLLLHPPLHVLCFYGVASAAASLALAVTFQLAHCVEGPRFPTVDGATTLPTEWAVHQVETAANFSTHNRALSWFVGGLNFQIEHHLFPRVCHVHLAELAPIVEATCREFGVSYQVNPSVGAALRSHARRLRMLGQAPA